MKPAHRLLQPLDPHPFGVENEAGTSPILFISDHAGVAIPQRLGNLGLPPEELSRHIAYDIGIYGVTTELARLLDAAYIFQPYSRLTIDCNRRPGKPQSVIEQSDCTPVPGNAALSPSEIRAREAEILEPYHVEIERVLCDRATAGRQTVIVAMHSYAAQLRGDAPPRPWEICVMAHEDWRAGQALVDVLRQETDLTVGVNEPYIVDMEMDYTIPQHGEARRLPYVEIELRQDLIDTPETQREWAERLSGIFPKAIARSGVEAGG